MHRPLIALLLLSSVAASADQDVTPDPVDVQPGLYERALDTLRALGVEVGGEQPEFLPPDQAFVLSVRATGPREVVARWDIADHYYLYRERFAVRATGTGESIGAPRFPTGTFKDDSYFGRVEIFHHALEITIPVTTDGTSGTLDLELRYQGCADAGLCDPPITRTVAVALP